MMTTQEVADVLVAANEQGFLPGRRAAYDVAADPLDIRHIPDWPGDGPMARETFLSIGEREEEAWRSALTDLRQEDVSASVDGDVVELKRTLCGTRPDGTPVRIPLRNHYTVEGGRVVSIVPYLDPDLMELIRDLLSAGGFDPDAEYESD